MREHRIFAATYDWMITPLEREVFGPRREQMLGDLIGDVLDVGAGTGANLPYLRAAKKVIAAEPDSAMRRKLAAKLGDAHVPVELSDAAAESLPFPDATFDAVVFTIVLCTVEDPDRAIAEARRVLKPAGRLIVLEHVRGTGRLAVWQDRITPFWRWIGGGCHPNRDTRVAIERAGFRLDEVTEFQEIPRWVPISPMLQAVASREG